MHFPAFGKSGDFAKEAVRKPFVTHAHRFPEKVLRPSTSADGGDFVPMGFLCVNRRLFKAASCKPGAACAGPARCRGPRQGGSAACRRYPRGFSAVFRRRFPALPAPCVRDFFTGYFSDFLLTLRGKRAMIHTTYKTYGLIPKKEVQSVCPLYSAACCARISAVDECRTPGQNRPGAGRCPLCMGAEPHGSVYSVRELFCKQPPLFLLAARPSQN